MVLIHIHLSFLHPEQSAVLQTLSSSPLSFSSQQFPTTPFPTLPVFFFHYCPAFASVKCCIPSNNSCFLISRCMLYVYIFLFWKTVLLTWIMMIAISSLHQLSHVSLRTSKVNKNDVASSMLFPPTLSPVSQGAIFLPIFIILVTKLLIFKFLS